MENKFIYYVEGETEKKHLEVLKKEYIQPGKIIKKNLFNDALSKMDMRQISPNTIVVIVGDVDTNTTDILDKNIEILKRINNVKKIIVILQIENFEDEIIFSTNLNDIKSFVPSGSSSDFKRDFIKLSNLEAKLKSHGFNIDKFWSRNATNNFRKYDNEASKIKLKTKKS